LTNRIGQGSLLTVTDKRGKRSLSRQADEENRISGDTFRKEGQFLLDVVIRTGEG
jgi:hypothetical protein